MTVGNQRNRAFYCLRPSRFMRFAGLLGMALLWLNACATGGPGKEVPGPARGDSTFADWAAIVVAADSRANNGNDTAAFDNARRDMAAALQKAGFQPAHIREFSVTPDRFGEPGIGDAKLSAIVDGLEEVSARAPAGCLLYFTSHGTRRGIVLGQGRFGPHNLDALVNRFCAGKPTIAVVSACFSGVFARPAFFRPNRMILTAARSDRSSFGCGEHNRYPFFDACLLQEFDYAETWIDLAIRAEGCVAQTETARGLRPPSGPQVYVGGEVREVLEAALLPGSRRSASAPAPAALPEDS